MQKSTLTEIDRLAIDEFKNEITKYFEKNIRVIKLYGSKAKGSATDESDIDILIVLKTISNRSKIIRFISELESKINLKYGVLISSYPVEEKYYTDNSTLPFIKEANKYGIVI